VRNVAPIRARFRTLFWRILRPDSGPIFVQFQLEPCGPFGFEDLRFQLASHYTEGSEAPELVRAVEAAASFSELFDIVAKAYPYAL